MPVPIYPIRGTEPADWWYRILLIVGTGAGYYSGWDLLRFSAGVNRAVLCRAAKAWLLCGEGADTPVRAVIAGRYDASDVRRAVLGDTHTIV